MEGVTPMKKMNLDDFFHNLLMLKSKTFGCFYDLSKTNKIDFNTAVTGSDAFIWGRIDSLNLIDTALPKASNKLYFIADSNFKGVTFTPEFEELVGENYSGFNRTMVPGHVYSLSFTSNRFYLSDETEDMMLTMVDEDGTIIP